MLIVRHSQAPCIICDASAYVRMEETDSYWYCCRHAVDRVWGRVPVMAMLFPDTEPEGSITDPAVAVKLAEEIAAHALSLGYDIAPLFRAEEAIQEDGRCLNHLRDDDSIVFLEGNGSYFSLWDTRDGPDVTRAEGSGKKELQEALAQFYPDLHPAGWF